jgi:UDP-N-acetylglucosamine 2-epimerase (non-hydrolysing)
MKHAIAVIGNSSSGIIEAPAFEIPTINIGSRQNGRLSAASILHCEPDVEQIKAAIQKLKSSDFMHNARKASLPYGRGNSSKEIIEVLKSLKSIPVKSFYDLEFKL